MYRKLRVSIIGIFIILVLLLISCTSATGSTTELFKEINRLEEELEVKESQIEDLTTELESVKQQLQAANEELGEEASIAEEPKEEEVPSETPSEFSIGDEIIFYDSYTNEEFCSVIINSISNYTEFDEYSEPSEGMRLVTINVEVKNLSSEVQGYNGLNYAFRDKDSYRYDQAAWGGKEPRLGSGDLAPGDKIRGWVTIELPEDIAITEVLAGPCYIEPPAIIKLETPLSK